jgi:glyoxylase-like metal-dependent hydrolase (beta-lactamase superfamily II)
MDTWKLIALDTGTSVIEKSILTYLTDVGQTLRIPRVMWYLEGSRRVIVDTSVDSEEVAVNIIGENLSRTPDQRPADALRAIGVDPGHVDLIIFTHLHWDHCGNLDLFPNSRLLAQREEIRYAYAPSRFFERAFLSPQAGLTPSFQGRRLEALVGDQEILPGLEVLHSPGHTPGSQAVRVKTAQGWFTIAGDAIFTYENLEKDIPPGFHVQVDQALDSMHRIARVSDVVLPSHDYKLFGTERIVELGG